MLIILTYLIFAMFATLWYDVTRYTIPNWLIGSLLVLYPVAVFLGPAGVDWPMAIVAMVITFAVGFGVYAMRWMGGGDIKLISVLALWVGLKGLPDFVVLFALLGGVFSILVLVARKIEPHLPLKNTPKLFQKNAPIPYGVAIGIAFLILLWQGRIPTLL